MGQTGTHWSIAMAADEFAEKIAGSSDELVGEFQ